MEDVLAKAWTQIKWEKDEVNYYPARSNRGDSRYNSRVGRRNVERRTYPYPTTDRKNDRVRDNRRRPVDQPHPQADKPKNKLLEYNLNTKPQEIVAVFKGMRGAVYHELTWDVSWWAFLERSTIGSHGERSTINLHGMSHGGLSWSDLP
ncbi:hypothetical protein ACOSQ2_015057 [Xanthoceras sorbifolium]